MLTTDQRGFLLSKKRTYWAKMNMDEARESIEIMEDAEVGRWFRSWIVGASGKEVPADRLATWSLEQRAGYTAGLLAFADAQAFSQKQRDRVSSRYTEKLPEVTTVPTTVACGSDSVAEKLPTNNEQRTTNKEQRAKSKEHPHIAAHAPLWELWKKFNEQGFGVRHLFFAPSMAASAKAREKECHGVDFLDVVAFGLERMASNPWFSDKPDAMTLDHFLRPANFHRYTSNYTPKAEA